MRSSVFLRRGVDLTIIPRRPGVLPCCRDSTACNGVLCLVGGFHCPIDVEAFPCWVVAVGLRARVWLGASSSRCLSEVIVYRPGPRRRRPRNWEKSGSSDVRCCASVSRGRTIGLSMYVCMFGHIALASDAVALSRLNGSALLGANSPCGSSVAVGESARGVPSPITVVRSSWHWAAIPAVLARGAVGSCVTSCLARAVGRDEAEG